MTIILIDLAVKMTIIAYFQRASNESVDAAMRVYLVKIFLGIKKGHFDTSTFIIFAFFCINFL